MERSLGLDLLDATEAAALAAAGWAGRGDKVEADRRAVDAMRGALSKVRFDGTVVIGEGEKDDAPMLFNGEAVGTGDPPPIDLAIDPLEGTRLLAETAPNSISVIGAAERGTMWSPGSAFYVDKLAVCKEAAEVIDIEATPTENLSWVAKALDRQVGDLGVFVLDKPRHEGLIAEIRAAGARVRLATDGDVLGALLAATPGTGIDLLMGIGGTPEAVITACALKVLGAGMQCRLAPQTQGERTSLEEEGVDTSGVLSVDDVVSGDHSIFVATGITGGDLLDGVGEDEGRPLTTSLLMDSEGRTARFVRTVHDVAPVSRTVETTTGKTS